MTRGIFILQDALLQSMGNCFDKSETLYLKGTSKNPKRPGEILLALNIGATLLLSVGFTVGRLSANT